MRGVAVVLMVSACGFQIETGGASLDASEGADSAAANDDAGNVIDGPGLDAIGLACPSGYVAIGGFGRYRVVEGADKTWSDAADDCNDDDDNGPFTLHTHLLVLGSEVERLGVTSSTNPNVSGNTWIGLSDRADESEFEWVTNEPTGGYPAVGDEPPWDDDDPDDANNNEDCVRFKNGSYVLEDKPCTDTESYVCECDAFAPN
jgi:hypothetical protein